MLNYISKNIFYYKLIYKSKAVIEQNVLKILNLNKPNLQELQETLQKANKFKSFIVYQKLYFLILYSREPKSEN